jgi:lysophospholipase L1-like esterase
MMNIFHMNFQNIQHSTFNIQRPICRLAAVAIFAVACGSVLAQTNVSSTNVPDTDQIARAHRVVNMPANPKLPSLFLIGDSTVRNGQGRGDGGQWGWGDYLAPFFDTNQVNVVNRALGGTSSRTFYRDQWPRVLELVKPGDFVIMQFGHNDGGPANDMSRARGSIKGVGDESVDITNMLTKKLETVHSFGWYEKQIVAETRARGSTPMICSLIPRNTWHEGSVARNKKDYAGWAGEAAQAANAPFLDINEIIGRQYDALGQEQVKALFIVGAGPHTSKAGAETNATCVVAALKGLKENPLAKYFSAKADGVIAADLSQPGPTPVDTLKPKKDAN